MDTMEKLRKKAAGLPLSPGVYLMLDKKGKVLYVGKAKRLKNRVSSYFQQSVNHTPKTKRLVARIEDFDTIIVGSEFEALVLECSLIKHHQPHYNILLKDGKGYPFIRVAAGEYPAFSVSRKTEKDNARYYGPYGGWGLTQNVIEAVCQTLRLPVCKKVFPRDFGKERPCLQYHMKRCIGVCRGEITATEYQKLIRKAGLMMDGKAAGLLRELEREMEKHAENLEFEAAAMVRDEIKSISALQRRQIVVGGGSADTDVVACVRGEVRSGVAVLHYMEGNLLGRDIEILDDAEEDERVILSAFVTQYYMARGKVPKHVLLSHEIEDTALLEEYFAGKGLRVKFAVPRGGEKLQLVRRSGENAHEEIERVTTREEKTRKLLEALQKLLGMENPPERIEAIDISNTGDSERVGVITCFKSGKLLKKATRQFIIKDESIHDDYHAMQEVLRRRFARLQKGDAGFADCPDLLLVDGGQTHASMGAAAAAEFNLQIPVFGMVKDDRHRTRGIVSPGGAEADLNAVPALFAFVGRIQEETHNAAFSYHQKRRSRFDSELDNIKGVGSNRREVLLRHFKSIKKIKAASLEELCTVVPKNTARAVFDYFHSGDEDSHNEG